MTGKPPLRRMALPGDAACRRSMGGNYGATLGRPFAPGRPKGSPRLWEIRGKAISQLPSPRVEHFTVLIIARRADNIADDAPRSCHPSQPALLLGLWRRRIQLQP